MEEISEPETFHKFLEEKVSNVQPGRGRSRVVCMRNTLIEISGQSIFHFSGPVFFIPLSYLLADISLRVVRDFQEFRMFAELDYIFRCNFFSVAKSLLTIIGRVFQAFIKIELQSLSPQDHYTINMQHMQHIKR